MAIQFKSGVNWAPSAQLQSAANILAGIYASYGLDLVITAGKDGKHMNNSLHYSGNALDARRWDLDNIGKTAEAVSKAKAQLGSDFDVVLESDHIHVEYDPKDGGGSATAGTIAGLSTPLIIGLVVLAFVLLKR